MSEAPAGARFNVVMTAPALAVPAVTALERAGAILHYTPPYPSAEAVAEIVAATGADAILCRQGRVDGRVMDASPRLRIVARHGVGTDEVDLDAARARGLLVTNAPGSNSRAVAEHALACMLALVKGLLPFGAVVAGGGWRGTAQSRDVAGLRLGLVGLGSIGREVARLAAPFGLVAAAWDPHAPGEAGVARVTTLAALLPRSDILSLHLPLLPETRHLIGAAALAALPPGAILINTARGGLVDEAALAASLDAGHLSGAAFDVFEQEPPAADNPLRRHPRVIATPHVAGVTAGSLDAMGLMAAECIIAALTGAAVPPGRVVCGHGR